jgi:NADPH:quinone reductase-like Zn-dependent oxidoreductase
LWWRDDSVPMPNVPGVDAIGKISRIDSESSTRYNLSVGDRVLTLTKWGGNSRYLFIVPSQVVKVPDHVDPAAAVCLVETYLSAFQILYHGLTKGKRYRKNSLRGKSYLILGSMGATFGQALSQFYGYAGVKTIYACAKQKHFAQLESLGIVPLSKDNVGWLESLRGKIDVIISFEEEVSPLQYKLLTDNGVIVLVCCGELKVDEDTGARAPQPSRIICRKRVWQQQSRTYTYDVFKEWDENVERCKKDLEHLVDLLGKEIIAPNVLDRIPLGKVARAQDMIEAKRLSGFLVCEPWLKSKSRAIRL